MSVLAALVGLVALTLAGLLGWGGIVLITRELWGIGSRSEGPRHPAPFGTSVVVGCVLAGSAIVSEARAWVCAVVGLATCVVSYLVFRRMPMPDLVRGATEPVPRRRVAVMTCVLCLVGLGCVVGAVALRGGTMDALA